MFFSGPRLSTGFSLRGRVPHPSPIYIQPSVLLCSGYYRTNMWLIREGYGVASEMVSNEIVSGDIMQEIFK
jgi:hypothetical protein